MVLILAAVIAVVVLVMSNWMQGPTLPSHHAAYPSARSATYATIGATRRLQLQARKEK